MGCYADVNQHSVPLATLYCAVEGDVMPSNMCTSVVTGLRSLPQDWEFRIAGLGVTNGILKRPGTLQDAVVDFLSDSRPAALHKL
ncbi:hypothetical protein ABBQ32_003338 [Trebouxia sp. C0010 RCD-2024]